MACFIDCTSQFENMAFGIIAIPLMIMLFGYASRMTQASLLLSRLRLVDNGYENLTLIVDDRFRSDQGSDVLGRIQVGNAEQYCGKSHNINDCTREHMHTHSHKSCAQTRSDKFHEHRDTVKEHKLCIFRLWGASSCRSIHQLHVTPLDHNHNLSYGS